jgi:hypothetical protein
MGEYPAFFRCGLACGILIGEQIARIKDTGKQPETDGCVTSKDGMNAGEAQYRIAHIRKIVSRQVARRTPETARRPNKGGDGECGNDRRRYARRGPRVVETAQMNAMRVSRLRIVAAGHNRLGLSRIHGGDI